MCVESLLSNLKRLPAAHERHELSRPVSALSNGSAVKHTPGPAASSSGPQSPERSSRHPRDQAKRCAGWQTAVLCVLGFVLVLANALDLAVMIDLTPKNDFGRTFLSVVAFVHGEDMYGMNPSIPWKLDDGSVIDLWNLNPPHFHLLLLPLAWLPVRPALSLWLLANALCGYFALRRIVREAQLMFSTEQRQLVLLGALGFIGTGSALVTGHMSFLLFWLVTLSWHAARHQRWTAAGVWLGLGLSVKPFLLFLVPYFLWRRQWRALAALAATVTLCVAAGLVVFGADNHLAWVHRLQAADHWAWLPMNASILGFLTRTFAGNPMFTPLAAATPESIRTIWLGAGIPLGVLTYAAAFRDSSRRGVDRAFALMLVGSLLLSPLGWTYYFWLPLGPLAVLLADWRRSKDADTRCSPWTIRLLAASLVGLSYPLWFIEFFQPVRIGTILIASLYFWGLLLVWLALLLDGLRVCRLNQSG